MVTLLRKIKILMSQILDFYLRQGCASYFFSGPVAKLAFMKIEILKNLEMQRNQNIPRVGSVSK